MDTTNTIASIRECLIPFIESTGTQENLILMDNAKVHTCRKTTNYLRRRKLNVIPFGGSPINSKNGFPPSSPDLNPIELLFGIWAAKVKKRNPKKIENFLDVIEEEWHHIPLSTVRKCINSQYRRVRWVANNGGKQYPK